MATWAKKDLQLNSPHIQIQQKLQFASIFPSGKFVVAKNAGASWKLNLSFAVGVLGKQPDSADERSFLKAAIVGCGVCTSSTVTGLSLIPSRCSSHFYQN